MKRLGGAPVRDPYANRREFLATWAFGAVSALGGSSVARPQAPPPARKATPDTLAIDCDFPGGNIVVERVEGDRVYLHQDQRDTPGFWFYWYFRVRGAAGRKLSFHFTQGNVIGVRGPAVSTDGGNTWAWLGVEAVSGASFTYRFAEAEAACGRSQQRRAADGTSASPLPCRQRLNGDVRRAHASTKERKPTEEVRFCLAMPYQQANLDELLKRYQAHPHLGVEHHATTRKGRSTRRLRLGRLDGQPNYRVLLTCRHHSCEMMASWTLEGIIEAVLAEDDLGRWFRRNVELLAVPFMDLDGVEDGDQGKNRKPHDHNRDYLGESIYPSVAALRRLVPRWSVGRLRVALDMHCPWIRGGGDAPSSNERIFLVGNPAPEIWRRQQQFGEVLQQVQTGPLPYRTKHNIPWGRAWNTQKQPRSCSRWTAELSGVLVGVTIEIPYANVAGKAVTPETARLLGHDLAKAIRRYLQR